MSVISLTRTSRRFDLSLLDAPGPGYRTCLQF